MPTLPPEPPPTPAVQVHQQRQVAESFGSDAERYDRARPPYPQALVDRIIAASPGKDVLDVGIGTGIAARQFQAAGCRVLGVEPDARMADIARRSGIDVNVATFETWHPKDPANPKDPTDRTFDAVVAGQAWHWIDPVAGAAKAAQVLRPHGVLALFWHVFEPPATVAKPFAEAYQRVVPDSPFNVNNLTARKPIELYQAMLDKAADGIREAGGFGELDQWRFDWEWTYTRDAWLDVLPTQGPLTRLPPDKLAEILVPVGAAIDAMGGSFTMSYTTVAAVAVRH